MFVNKQVTVTV